MMPISYLDFAISIAQQAGRILRESLGGAFHVEHKGPVDLVTSVDKEAEQFIVSALRKQFPDHGIVSEEGQGHGPGAEFTWFIDPLDGTTNYVHGYPVFSTSLGLARGGEPVVGVIYQPMTDELFWAGRGQGAFLNGQAIRVSKTARLTEALVATGFPYDIATSGDNNLAEFSRVARIVRSPRCSGSAAIDLCSVACGRLDAYWEKRLSPWDAAAGSLIVTEAGGKITDARGEPWTLWSSSLLVSNVYVHDELVRILNGVNG